MNIRQLRATQARVQREQLIRQITGRIQEAPDVDGVLQTAIQELGRAFGTSRNRIQFRPPREIEDNGANES
jgi:GAF domain-containing protein